MIEDDEIVEIETQGQTTEFDSETEQRDESIADSDLETGKKNKSIFGMKKSNGKDQVNINQSSNV